ncbi:MAG: ABC transporter ATP-binding protein [Thermoanaerobaculia bacterium]
MTAVSFENVTKRFDDVVAVDDVSLEIDDGEFFTLLGPSGSGKTTCLRLIGGFDLPDRGRIRLHGIEISDRPPYERDVNTVFQDYALFPHLSVLENVAYGPRVRGVDRRERDRLAHEMLEIVELPGLGDRRPSQLSGGQRQRVALARALVNRPRVLLLDEPLGALDLKLRQQMQVELKSLQKRVGITFVFVTHDQEEALSMSDRLAIFHGGRVEQVGTPTEVYEAPGTLFVANFLGSSNILHGDSALRLLGRDGIFALRPEKIRLLAADATPPEGSAAALVTIREIAYGGPTTRYQVELDDGPRLLVLEQNLSLRPGARVLGGRALLCFDREEIRALGPGPP